MCGIAGLIGLDRETVHESALKAAAAMAHRGPDDQGVVVRPFGIGWVGLSHRRLSILDLSALGHQPMCHTSSGAEIIFNGEIYNFQQLRTELIADGESFKSGTDTEVLLVGLIRYGQSFLKRVEGMYAFAFLDPRLPLLLLGRDPAGIKPLYFCLTDDEFFFASECRTLCISRRVAPQLDCSGIASFLAYGAVQQPLTVFRDVSSLQPGACLLLQPDKNGHWKLDADLKPFWHFPRRRSEFTEPVAIEAVRTTVDAAVRDHLISDVPVGLFLSSGIDSTILAGLASRYSPAMNSLTVVFEDEEDINEQRLAHQTATQFGLTHTEVTVPSSAAEAAMEEWLLKLDQPSIDGLNVFIISKAVRQSGIKVALSGLGGDELFGGYPSFQDVPRLYRLMRLIGRLPAQWRHGMACVATIGRSATAKTKLRDIFRECRTVRSLYLQRRRNLSDEQLNKLGIRAKDLGLDREFLVANAADDIDADEEDVVRVISQLESRLYQGNMLLRDADANGMAFGLEIRVPFLDQRLLDLAHAIPGSIRLPPGADGKHLLRRAFPDLLRSELLRQRKRGFVLPIGRWMAGPLRPVCETALETLKDCGILRPSGVDAIWQEFLAHPKSPLWTRALALVVLGRFVENSGATAA